MQKTFEPHRLTQFTTAGSTSRRKVDMRTLITSISVRELDPKTAVSEAVVQVSGYFYTVDLGPDVHPRSHHVGKDKRCSCPLGPDCPSVPAVVAYLRKGGQRATDPGQALSKQHASDPANSDHIRSVEKCAECSE